LNKAPFSVELCDILLSWYANQGYVVYAPFM